MKDRKSAITHLQIISTWASFARERDLQFFTKKHLEDIEQWARDAIALLKEKNGCENCAIAIEDRQPVVRCKDCTYLNADTGICIVGIPHGHKDTFYCTYGKRR